MSSFPDTGPQEDGTRTSEQWMNAMGQDAGIIRMQLQSTLEDDLSEEEKAKACAVAAKEARRLESDIYRFAREVHGIERDTINAIRL